MKIEDFDSLFQAHAQPLFAFLVYHCGDRTLAEDVMSDAFERALRARGRFDVDRGAAKTWLFSIALNRLRDLQRRAATESRAIDELQVDGEPETGRFEDQVSEREMIREALLALPENERVVLALRFGGDLSVPEIARLLDQPLSRVEGRVYRGLAKLRDYLD